VDRLTQQDDLLAAQLNLVSEQFSEKSSYLNLLRVSGLLGTVLKSEIADKVVSSTRNSPA
jgi:hypothetical protein